MVLRQTVSGVEAGLASERMTRVSKGAFKRAIGHLMKEGKVEIKDKRIYAK